MLEFAQIGVGYWGPNLLRNIVANKKCNVKSVVDFSEERRKFVKGLYPSINVSANGDDIFNDPSIDAVIIATPAETHYGLAVKCLEAGKHILVEKPMAKSVLEVRKIRELAIEKNLVAMVGHTFLYNSAVRYIKKLISSNELGKIRYIF